MGNLSTNQSISDTLDNLKTNILANLHCHNVGRIIDFNSEKFTATIEVMQLKEWYDKTINPSIITNVPIVTFGVKQARITMPNPVGEYVVLMFMDRNIDNFLETGEAHLPETDRMHSISDCVALLTIDVDIETAPNYDEEALTLVNSQTYIKLYEQQLQIANASYNLGNLIKSFLEACEDMKINPDTGILIDDSKKAFTDLKPQFADLLTTIEENEQ